MTSKIRLSIFLFLLSTSCFASGPLLVGGPVFGKDGQPFVWNPANMPIQYRVDTGPLSAKVNNADALVRVRKMFDVWQNVPTANISYKYAGAITNGAGQQIDVSTVAQFNDVIGVCDAGTENPVIFDADGSLLRGLGADDSIIGVSSICNVDPTAGFILSAFALMNGKWQDGNTANGELSAAEFNAAIVHELGHLSGLGHTQVNLQVLSSPDACDDSDLIAGLPLMFPFSVCEPVVDSEGFPVLSADDLSGISNLYPNAQTASSYGTITGTVFFRDGLSQAQGVNVIARRLDDPNTTQDESLRIAVSAVSGERFTGNPGQDVTGDNSTGDLTGSRDPNLIGKFEIHVPPGTYTVEIQSVFFAFTGGSSLTPLDPPIQMTAPSEFWNQNESGFDLPGQSDTISVGAGQTIENINIIENNVFENRFDGFEDGAQLEYPSMPNAQEAEVQA